MKNTIKFSVIMPCYNSAAYVKNALDSIKNQTYTNWELIAVNDGSKDETPEILRAYAQEDNRIKVFEKENGGYATAVNFGLDHISGDYFLMLGSDDRLEPSLFENLCSQLNEIDFLPDCFAFRAIITTPSGETTVDSITDFQIVTSEENTSFSNFCNKYPFESKIFSCRDTARCYKKSILGDLRYFGWSGFDADGIFSVLFCHRATSFACFPVDGYLWFQRNDSVSASISLPKSLDILNNWRLFFDSIRTFSIEKIIPIEKYFFKRFYAHIVNISISWKLSLKHSSLFRKCAKCAKKHPLSFEFSKNEKNSLTLIAFCPLLYSLFYKFKLVFHKS